MKLTTGERNSALNIWNKVMTKLHEGLPAKPFFEKAPANIVKVSVCMDSGLRPNKFCSKDPRGSRVRTEIFIKGTEPGAGDVCKVHYVARITTLQVDAHGRPLLANEFCPPDTVANRVCIRRPVEYKPRFPGDKYPSDTKYEAAEGEFCTLHGPGTALPTAPATTDSGIAVPEVTPTPVPEVTKNGKGHSQGIIEVTPTPVPTP